MEPANSKSLFSFLCNQMEKLDKGEINVEQAKAQANLGKQVNNVLKYELDRANLQMKLQVHNNNYDNKVSIREIESKNFES